MATLEEKMLRHPLKVYYPDGGTHHILTIYNNHTRRRFLMAKTEEAVKGLLAASFKKDNYDVVEYGIADIVAPPLELQQAFAEAVYDETIQRFKQRVYGFAQEYLENYGEHPYFKMCKRYQYDFSVEDVVNEDEAEWYEDSHLHCENCKGKKLTIETDWKTLYENKRHLVEEFDGAPPAKTNRFEPYPVLSAAKPAPTLENLYAAEANHGNHCEGNVFNKVQLRLAHYLNDTLFFCYYETKPIPQWTLDIVEVSEKEKVKAHGVEARRRLDENKQYNEKVKNTFLAIME